MEVKDIVAQEVARQAEFGYEPGWEDMVIAGYKAGIKEVVEWIKENAREDILEDGTDNFYLGISPKEWQEQLKEWEYGQE